jgi:hypothetical protein
LVEWDLGAADKGLQVEVGAGWADAVLVHSITVALKPVVGNPNLHDMAWFTRFDRTFTIWRGLHDLA